MPAISKLPKLIGAHVSAAGGVHNAVGNSIEIGANAFALFLKSQRKWSSPPLTSSQVALFREACSSHSICNNSILPHGSYLINLGNPDEEKREKSYNNFLDDLKRCEMLGLRFYNFHPGSTVGACSTEESIKYIAENINRAHKATKEVVCVLENMAGAGHVVGSRFQELRAIIDNVKEKSRVGVCLDTCHMFAAGYDIRTKETYEDTMKEFDKYLGGYLRGMHLNDSLTELGSKRDRHANLGQGHIGWEAFRLIMNDLRTNCIPLILETPLGQEGMETWKRELEALRGLIGASNVPHTQPYFTEKKKKEKAGKK
ncbi:uncharacterized protein VTP21DRAFT_1837 [Calcarisporiella thermophila]|uniref:uncharacterized protein n=1 Tax=Calcarisporiella thermophila TaxID=911321 RepID=UPI003743A6E2